jgi:hypothetical protein
MGRFITSKDELNIKKIDIHAPNVCDVVEAGTEYRSMTSTSPTPQSTALARN